MSVPTLPFPSRSPIVDMGPLERLVPPDLRDVLGLITREWNDYFAALEGRGNQTPSVRRVVREIDIAAAISPTPIPLPTLPASLYRVSWYARITQAATVSSSLQVVIGFTDAAFACEFQGTAATGNTLATVNTGTVVLRSDAGAPVNYSTIYASTGATPMRYDLVVTCEAIPG